MEQLSAVCYNLSTNKRLFLRYLKLLNHTNMKGFYDPAIASASM